MTGLARRLRQRPLVTLGLRARLTVIGVLGLAVGLAAGGVILLGALGYTLQRTVDTEALRTADAVALLAAEDALPDPLPVAGGQLRVQVVDAQGRVRAASIDADRLVPMLPPEQLDRTGQQRTFVPGQRLGLDGPVRVVAVPVGTLAEPLTVLVGKSMADVRHSVHIVRTLLLVAFPLLVAGLAVVAWRVVGATLRPVEALRSGAAEITGRGVAGRLPVPESRDEIHRLAVTLNDMLGRLESARDRQRAFVADAAHELRSPLTNMRTELEVAQRLADRTDWPAVAENLLADTERLGRLTDDLLLLARLDEAAGGDAAPRRPVATGPVELGELLAAVAARCPSPPVRVALPPGPLWTVGDQDELRRILANLVDNAVRHARSRVVLTVTGPYADPSPAGGRDGGRVAAGGPDGGRVAGGGPDGARAAGEAGGGRPTVGGPDGPDDGRAGGSGLAYHLVTVTDDGPGIPVADRERVFHRFTRLDDARARDAGGAGLGLAIVRELVRRAGGAIELADADADADADPDPDPGPDVDVDVDVDPDAEPDGGPDVVVGAKNRPGSGPHAAPASDAQPDGPSSPPTRPGHGPGFHRERQAGPAVGPGLRVRLWLPLLPDPDGH